MAFSLALSGGGCRGAAHIGIFKALFEHSLYPSMLSGASAGALAAALCACGISIEEMQSIVHRLEKEGGSLMDINCAGALFSLFELSMKRPISLSAVLRGKGLRKLLYSLFGKKTLNQVELPLAIASVNLSNGSTVAFSQLTPTHKLKNTVWRADALLCEAVYSSCCVPAVFPPLKSKEEILVDGGVADNLPVDLLMALDAPNIIAVDISNGWQKAADDSIFEIASHSISVMGTRLRECSYGGERLLIRPRLPDEAGLFTFSQMEECVQAGYDAANELIDVIKLISS